MVLGVYIHAFTFPSNVFVGESASLNGLNFSIQYFISQGLARFRVPMFFIISGYFFFLHTTGPENTIISKVVKRVRTVLVPYLLWSMGSILTYALMQHPVGTRAYFTHNRVYTFIPQEILYKIFCDPIAYQLWFLRDLFLLVLIGGGAVHHP